ncbi:MAG: polyketide synthase dehydratase domain-containing protein, partial [Gammaproteobacteria bacterium]|nr:polyketide synthase dehydratase domain-containing protein [Gammaproteobacteria bacterium]
HIRQPVRFYSAVQQMLQDGADCLLEIAPHHILLFSLHDIAKAYGAQTRVIPTLKRDADCHQQLQAALAAMATEPEMTSAIHSEGTSSAVSTSASKEKVLQVICRQLQLLLPEVSKELDPARGFFQLGLTSVQVLTFCQRLAAELNCAPDFSWCFDHPTPLQLAAELSGAAQLSAPASATVAACTEIAIVGMGCRFPGGANNPDLFWQHLVEGKSAICEVPAERWQADAYYAEEDTPGKSRSKWAGFLKDWDVRQFDAALFDISPAEARALDPQQRLLLEVTYEALQHAGLVSGQNLPRDTGVFVGISTDDYKASQLYSGDLTKINTYTGAGCMYSAAAGRLSYWLGLQGPNKAVDTACSSSLVALHDACQAIRQGECSTALVAGVNLMLTPHLFVCFSALGALSTDGKCRAFAEGANGYVRGEGCGVLVLKSRAQAEADGDQILALIAGTAVNQDGVSSSLTAPNGAAQQQVIRSALARAGVNASQISYVETHGTGTPLGDPIEAKALGTVYGQAVARSTPLQIGSGKTVFGHLEAAAGILSVIKTTLCLQHQQLVPSRNFDVPSPLIDFAGLKLQVVTELQSTALQYAAVSSFGFSGTNAHIILSAPPAIASSTKASAPDVTGCQLLTLSARNAAALATLGRDWLQVLSQLAVPQQTVSKQVMSQSTTAFADVCRASYLQRPHLRYRLAVTGTDAATMAARLGEALADGATPAPAKELAWPVLLSAQAILAARQDLLQFCAQTQTQTQSQPQATSCHLVWPSAPEFATYWREYMLQQDDALPDFSLQLLRWQLVVLLQLDAGIDVSAAEALLPAELPRPAHAADWLGLPLLLLRDDGLSQQWQWYFSEQMRVDTLSVSETDSWPDRDWLLQQVACHYQQQATINWHRLQQWFGAPAAGTAAQLPLYPYQRKNFWLDPLPVTPVVANTTSTQLVSFGRPALMNEVQRLAGFPDLCWYRLLFDRQQQFLAQHLIFNTPISPAAAHVAMLLTALQQLGQPGWAIRQLELHQPLVLPAGTSQRAVQLTLKGELLNGAGSQ